MDISISLIIEKEKRNQDLVRVLENLENQGFYIQVNDNISISKDYDNINKSINLIASDFILHFEKNFFINIAISLRLGIFYSKDEIAFLSIDLSKNLIHILNKFDIDMEINAYECKE